MTKSKIIAAIGASTLILSGVAVTSAAAQPGRYYDRGYNDYGRNLNTSYVDSLEWRINNSPMPNGERRQLLRELRQLQPIAYRVETGQASRWEYNRLAEGVRRIENATRYASADRYQRYGYNNRRW